MTELTPEDIANGFVRPVHRRVEHNVCGRPSEMKIHQSFDMARDPKSWATCWCMVCGRRLPVDQFKWPDGSQVGS